MKQREFEYIGEPISKIGKENHADFVLLYQQSILLSLVKRNLLTLSQAEKCMEEIERRQNKSLV